MIVQRKIGEAYNTPIEEYIVDTEEDFLALDVSKSSMGSTCYIIESKIKYILNSNHEWKIDKR